MTVIITKRTATRTCYTYTDPRDGVVVRCNMLHAKFAEWQAKCPSYTWIEA